MIGRVCSHKMRARSVFGLIGLWVASAVALSQVTGRVTDWFVMTDELLYERFAISIARTLSPVAEIHGRTSGSLDQLYPLLIAPLYRSGFVPHDLHEAHLLNAWVMSSACIPAFLLTRRVTRGTLAAWIVAVLTVCVPWIFYASFLLTEVVAYPAFLWALLGMQRAVAEPSRRNDLFALAGVVLAACARTQFVLLIPVLLVAVLLREAGVASARGPFARMIEAARRAFDRHRILAVAYAGLAAVSIGMAIVGSANSLLGTYGTSASQGIPSGFWQSLLEHLATLSLGVGIVPVVVGVAWLAARVVATPGNRDLHAFACVGLTTFAALVVEVTIFDLRLGAGPIVYDRYLFYLAPVALVACAAASFDTAALSWPLLVVGSLVAAGFALNVPPSFEWQQFSTLSPDAPISVLYRLFIRLCGGMGWTRITLAMATVLGAAVSYGVLRRFGPKLLGAALAVLLTLAIPTETTFVLEHLFAGPGWSERPLTGGRSGTQTLDWVDRAVGPTSNVTMVAYHVSSAYLVSLNYWRDMEFWNKSAERNIYAANPHAYAYTGTNFPRLGLNIDPATGRMNVSPSPFALQGVTETRFRIAGRVRMQTQEAMLIDALRPWRASWMTFGLTDDGWVASSVSARLRVFAVPAQRSPRIQSVTLQIWAPQGVTGRLFRVASNVTRSVGAASGNAATTVGSLPVCVPAGGYSDVTITGSGSSEIPGDLSLPDAEQVTRQGSLYLADISVSDNLGPRCVSK